jgi:hypothetical protein
MRLLSLVLMLAALSLIAYVAGPLSGVVVQAMEMTGATTTWELKLETENEAAYEAFVAALKEKKLKYDTTHTVESKDGKLSIKWKVASKPFAGPVSMTSAEGKDLLAPFQAATAHGRGSLTYSYRKTL